LALAVLARTLGLEKYRGWIASMSPPGTLPNVGIAVDHRVEEIPSVPFTGVPNGQETRPTCFPQARTARRIMSRSQSDGGEG